MLSLLVPIGLLAVVLTVLQVTAPWAHRRRASALPRLTVAEFDRIEAEMERLRLPLCRLVPTDGPPAPRGSRLGGAPWSPGGDDAWPVDDEGRPLLFLAQVNLAEAEGLEDVPSSGLLQVFLLAAKEGDVASDGEAVARLRWFEDPHGEARLPIPDLFTGRRSRSLLKGRARTEGVPLRLAPDALPPLPHIFPLWEQELDIYNRLPAEAEAEARAKAWEDRADALHASYGTHWIGGHPSFVQEDVRIGRPELRDLYRMLLHLGPDEFFDRGDAGELNLLIRRADLVARRFDRIWLTLDCS